MKAEFSRVAVSKLVAAGEAQLKTGPFGTQLKASDYTEEGTPVINVRNIGFGGIKADKLEYISPSTRDRLSSHVLQRGDIVFGRKGAVERHVYIREEQDGWFQGSDCLRLRFTSPRIEPLFASYFFLTPEHQRWMMNQCSHGATMASLNQEILERIELPLPPLQVQRRIAGILSAYDDLIENNQRRIRILEEMARSLYREWFVHFRFPGHDNVKMVPSAIGPIPQGWELGRLDDVIVLQRGFDLPKALRLDGSIPIYAATGVVGFHNEAKVKASGIVTGRSGTIGDVLYVQEDFWPLNTALWGKEFPKSEPLYAYYVLSSLDLRQYNSGAAVPTLNRNDIHGLNAIIAPRSLQRNFQEIAGAVLRQARTLKLQIQNLRRTRDLLLPRLLSGMIAA